MTQEVIVGGTGMSNDTGFFPVLLNKLIGTRFKVIVGYKSVADGRARDAEGRGSGQDRLDLGRAQLRPDRRLARRRRRSTVIVQMGLAKSPRIPATVPLAALELCAQSREDRQVMQLIFSPSETGYPSFMGPGVPPERIAAIRKAFAQTVADPRLPSARRSRSCRSIR